MKRLLPMLLIIVLLLCSCTRNTTGNNLSRGIDYLISSGKLEKCTLSSSPLMFERQEFENICGESLSHVVIASLPDESVGTLTLGGSVVKTGQTLSAEELDLLRFTPCGRAGSSSEFSVVCRGGYGDGSTIGCSITLTEFENRPPVANNVSLNAISGVPCSGALSYTDPDGDAMKVRIDSYPSYGTLQLLDGGRFVYTPDIDHTGADSIKFTVTDRFGLSSEAMVSISVSSNPNKLIFDDVDADIHSCCVRACLSEIMTYHLKDGKYLFYPNEEINRIDFLVMLMTACGQTNVYSVKDTVFTDDTQLSDGRKAYLAKAVETGIVDLDSNFRPFEKVTRAQAGLWITRALEIPTVSTSVICADMNEVPAWATESVKAVISSGIMPTYRGYFRPEAAVTKGAAAEIFDATDKYLADVMGGKQDPPATVK